MCPEPSSENNEPYYGLKDPRRSFVLYVAKGVGNNDIYMMDKDGDFRTALTDTEKADEIHPDWSNTAGKIDPETQKPEGLIVFSSNRNLDGSVGEGYEIWTMKRDGTGLKQRTFGFADAFRPRWSPDGQKIVFYSNTKKTEASPSDIDNADNNIYLLNLKDKPDAVMRAEDVDVADDEIVINSDEDDKNPVFYGDNKIVYQSDNNLEGLMQLRIHNLDDKTDRSLFDENATKYNDKNPDVIHQNKAGKPFISYLIFDREESGSNGNKVFNQYVVDFSEKEPYEPKKVGCLAHNSPKGSNFKWTDDEKSLIFTSYKNNQPEIYLAPLEKIKGQWTITNISRLSHGDMLDTDPSWEYYEKNPVCHRAAGQTSKKNMFRGGIDELKVWNYAVSEGLHRLSYDEGREIMQQDWFKHPEKKLDLCPSGKDKQCPEYTVCNTYVEKVKHFCRSDEDCEKFDRKCNIQTNTCENSCDGDKKCGENEYCFEDPQTKIKTCAQGCKEDSDCAENHFCSKEFGDVSGECLKSICEQKDCVNHDDCGLYSFCIGYPFSDGQEKKCTSECIADNDCLEYVCPAGGPCAVCDHGRCLECRNTADCPDVNAYRCDVHRTVQCEDGYTPTHRVDREECCIVPGNKCVDLTEEQQAESDPNKKCDSNYKYSESKNKCCNKYEEDCVVPKMVTINDDLSKYTCTSECYRYENGETEFMCRDFHYCLEGRCKMIDFEMDEFLPATLKGLFTPPQYLIEIKAAGFRDYNISPRMVFEVLDKFNRWVQVGAWTVHNNVCEPVKVTVVDKSYQKKKAEYDKCIKNITTDNIYKAFVDFTFDAARIRLEKPYIRRHDTIKENMKIKHHDGSILEVGYPVEFSRYSMRVNDKIQLKSGHRALIINELKVNTTTVNPKSAVLCSYDGTSDPTRIMYRDVARENTDENKRDKNDPPFAGSIEDARFGDGTNSFYPINCTLKDPGSKRHYDSGLYFDTSNNFSAAEKKDGLKLDGNLLFGKMICMQIRSIPKGKFVISC